ncbi:MAG: glutamate--cysteine ligase, partial [Planctomycetaceae bacterium]|nr:glutamate--cysteine ligase [Planctomycetaceae bacterium]
MPSLPFTRNETPSLGVEVELQLVDAETFELTSAIEPVLSRLPEELKVNVKPELMQCYLEINTGVCRNVGEARDDLSRIL